MVSQTKGLGLALALGSSEITKSLSSHGFLNLWETLTAAPRRGTRTNNLCLQMTIWGISSIATCRCARGARSRANSTVCVAPLLIPGGSDECAVLGSSSALRLQPSR